MPWKIILIVIGVYIPAYAVWYFLRRRARRNRLRQTPLPPEAEAILEKTGGVYRFLPPEVREQLNGLIQVFLGEKRFVGCGGLEITDEIRFTIAAQACLLLLNRPTRYFPKLRTIFVYPGTYTTKGLMRMGSLVVEGESSRLGESWTRGPVVLAWDSVRGGAVNVRDGQNVVIHEFAHQLDQEDGQADGAPPLGLGAVGAWARVLHAEYDQLCKKTRRRKKSVLNRYGATNPAEFFAVATEAFFEKPRQMLKKHPELYEELQDYYRLDPAEWSFRETPESQGE